MSMKTTIAKWFTGAALAGALLFAAPHKAEAQRVGFGISIGTGPVYGGYYHGYYGPRPYVRPYPYYGYSGYYGPAYYGPRPYYYAPRAYYGPRPYYGGGRVVYRGGWRR